MIRIAICEDERIFLNQLSEWMRAILDKHSIIYSMGTYENGNAVLAREAFDIVLLDIEMEPLNGLELAKRLRSRGDESKLIFITAHERYALEAYDVEAFHYLVKPVDRDKLERVILKICSSLQEEQTQAITIRQGVSVRKILFEQILYLEVMGRKIYLHTKKEIIPFYGKLEELEQSLPESFFRCHRSYIVNFDHV